METQAKKKNRPYKRRYHPIRKINVENYLAFKCEGPVEEWKAETWLIAYLKRHLDAEFSNYEEIADALRKEFKLDDKRCSKGVISNAVNFVRGDLIFGNETFYFEKVDKIYKLRSRFAKNDPLLNQLFEIKDVFRKETVHQLSEYSVVFAVVPSEAEQLKKGFETLLGAVCFGVMVCGEHLVIMLDKDNAKARDAQTMLLSFFRRKAEYEKEKEKKEKEEKEKKQKREEMEAKMRELRNKYAKHNLKSLTGWKPDV